MCCFTCHVSLCLLEPTGNLQIMETQFHNSLIPSWEKQLQICMLQTYSADTQTGTWPYTWKNIVQSQRFLKTRFSSFVCMWAVQQHPSIWRLFPKRSGKFFFFCKHFNGCIVGYLNFIGLSAKTLENLLFWENVVTGQFSSKCPGLSVRTAMYLFSLDGLFTHSNVLNMIQCLPTTSSCYSD